MQILPRLEDMRVFAKLAAVGTFTGTARELGVTKQTVSRRLMELEQALGVELVRRTTRRVTLTDVGEAYAARCSEVLRLADEANRAVASDVEAIAGVLRVTADPTLGELLLQDIVTRFATNWPDVTVEVLLTSRKVDLLEEGFDAALCIGPPPDVHHLASRKLAPASMWTVASPDYLEGRSAPRRVEHLADHDCLAAVSNPGQVVWPLRVGGKLRMVPIRARIQANDVATVRAAALAGLGITHLPSVSVRADIRDGRLRRLLPHLTPELGGIHVVYPHSRLLAAKVQAFVALTVDRSKVLFRG
ncbi:MAG: LysR family transcriptional regulator [Proteobacteria bacterium]|nr:LysR family transcriptional regulator [Pseudomonadota bacterium]MCP4918717.1 LysR family transcriptional regulator [Pseudomonadota bacterium]